MKLPRQFRPGQVTLQDPAALAQTIADNTAAAQSGGPGCPERPDRGSRRAGDGSAAELSGGADRRQRPPAGRKCAVRCGGSPGQCIRGHGNRRAECRGHPAAAGRSSAANRADRLHRRCGPGSRRQCGAGRSVQRPARPAGGSAASFGWNGFPGDRTDPAAERYRPAGPAGPAAHRRNRPGCQRRRGPAAAGHRGAAPGRRPAEQRSGCTGCRQRKPAKR